MDLYHFHYLDDVLFLAHDPLKLTSIARAFVSFLESQQLVVSAKSSLIPAQEIRWLGKDLNFVNRTITPSPAANLRSCALTLLGGLRKLGYKSRLRIAGNLLWIARPLPGSTLFLHGLYHTRQASNAEYLSNASLRTLLNFLPLATKG